MSNARTAVTDTAEKIAALPDQAVTPPDAPEPVTATATTAEASAPAAEAATVPGGDTLTPAQWSALESAMPAEQFRGLQQVVKEIGNPWQPAKVQTVLDFAESEYGLSHEEALQALAGIRSPRALIKYYRDAQAWAEARKTPKAPAPNRSSDRPTRRNRQVTLPPRIRERDAAALIEDSPLTD